MTNALFQSPSVGDVFPFSIGDTSIMFPDLNNLVGCFALIDSIFKKRKKEKLPAYLIHLENFNVFHLSLWKPKAVL